MNDEIGSPVQVARQVLNGIADDRDPVAWWRERAYILATEILRQNATDPEPELFPGTLANLNKLTIRPETPYGGDAA